MEDPIFIVGLPRSGSTLWQNIITSNPKVLRLAEMHFLNPWHKDFRSFLRKHVGDLSNDTNVEKMLELIFSKAALTDLHGPFWHFGNIEALNDPSLQTQIRRRILDSDRSLESVFKALIEDITRVSGYDRCCLKFPVYVNHVPELLEWYPKCKVVHITRDPRAIAVSKTNDPGGTAKRIQRHPRLAFALKKVMLLFATIQYIWTSKLYCKYKGFQNYRLFRYEDLLFEPEKIIKELCDFVGIDFVPEMLAPQRGNQKGQTSSVTGKKQERINKEAAYHWKNVISPFDKKVITMLTRNSMRRFGYDVATYDL